MWRWAHFNGMSRIARRLLPVVEYEMKLAVYPDQNTCWHYDDKIAQAYLLKAANIPIPQTWVWFDREQATRWAEKTTYPFVLKLTGGASSSNVKKISNFNEAFYWIDRLFSTRITALSEIERSSYSLKARIRQIAKFFIRGPHSSPLHFDNGFEPQSGYFLAQEFLPDNEFDTRVTVIGDRAFARRRFNRPGDFRASGSGNTSWDPKQIDIETVRLAFRVARRLNTQAVCIDGLRRNDERVIGEISYTCISSAVYKCPGHWKLQGDPETGELVWQAGHLWPEEAQIQDFLPRLSLANSLLISAVGT